MKIKCLIVDDELTARQGLSLLCEEHDSLDVIGTCKNGMEAIEEIKALKPDLVLLDVQMPKVNGFEVLASIDDPKPQVIFITAFDEFAIKTFEVNALDYLLKPFSDSRFEQAIERAIERIKSNLPQKLPSSFSSNSQDHKMESDDDRLAVKIDGAIHILNRSQISHVEAFDYYVKIHLREMFFLLRETMKTMETKLDSDQFKRVHKSFIVNKSHVKALENPSKNEHELVLQTGLRIRVSRSKFTEVKKWLTS